MKSTFREMQITTEEIEQLLALFSRKGQYDARTSDQFYGIHKKCEDLFEKDYVCSKITNEKGILSPNYPSLLIIPVEERLVPLKDSELSSDAHAASNSFDALKFKEVANKSNVARCRLRFPVPVIMYNGKYVCRSATLACGGEIMFRDMSGLIFSSTGNSECDDKFTSPYSRNSAYFTELRSQDIKLLKQLSVSYICDLMVENKKVKYGLKVSSSEKIDKENRYSEFKILQLPYPGCEFFKKFRDSNYVAEGLKFDWDQNYVDSSLTLPSDSIASTLGIHWSNYKMWDLVRLTQNYLKLLITYFIEGSSSILVHCISGWDRTPLFVSLLRLSLWADGRIHQSLSPVEMAYLTLAYDWYLFGHDLPTRLRSGEEILFFCFEFLKFIVSDEFSSKKRSRKVSSNCAETPLDILIEEESSCVKTCENGGTSIFYTSLESVTDVNSSIFYSHLDSDSDSVKSLKANDSYHSDSDYPPTLVNSAESLPKDSENLVKEIHSGANLARDVSASSPVPVPRQRVDSMSSLGSWQYISGTGSLMGSVTSRGSSAEVNSNSSTSGSTTENGNCPMDRSEKLHAVRTIIHQTYLKVTENSSAINAYYFPWRR